MRSITTTTAMSHCHLLVVLGFIHGSGTKYHRPESRAAGSGSCGSSLQGSLPLPVPLRPGVSLRVFQLLVPELDDAVGRCYHVPRADQRQRSGTARRWGRWPIRLMVRHGQSVVQGAGCGCHGCCSTHPARPDRQPAPRQQAGSCRREERQKRPATALDEVQVRRPARRRAARCARGNRRCPATSCPTGSPGTSPGCVC